MQINNKLIKQEKVLYNNATGTAGTVTLSETSANFAYIEIFYRNSDSHYTSLKVYSPNGKIVNLSVYNANGSTLWVKSNQAAISGTSITIDNAVDFNITSSVYTAGNVIFITKVVGYK